MDQNYAFFMETDISPYVGKWIAIADGEIVASGENVKEVFKEARKKTKSRPLLTKVPTQETMIL
ncbi:MAG TPA: DUF5678 domain-containing protein [Candidatus Nanoarchaeia archaeon]|nr:DUF5678 domain-containing protein [Candidatus Nanoarchaeia archaeon]